MRTPAEQYIIAEYYQFNTDTNLILEAEKLNKAVVMTGILQKANTLNRNGRVYPYNILKREAVNYMSLVEEGTAGGELDHPDCNLFGSNVLTKDGWKLLADISENEKILTLNINTNKIEIQEIEKKIDQPYKGKIYHIHGRNIDMKVTPNHRFLVNDRNGNPKYITAEEIYNTNTNKLSIPKKGIWEGKKSEYFILPGIPEKKIYKNDIKIKSEDWFAFLGIYLADGHSAGTNGGRQDYLIAITQKKEESKKIIENLLDELPFEFHKYKKNDGTVQFTAYDKRLHNYLFKLGNSRSKYIPFEIKQASPELLTILFDNFLLGDGRSLKCGDKKQYSRKSVFSTSKRLIEDLQEILFKMGGHGNITTYQPKDRYITDKKTIEKEVDCGDGTIQLIKEVIKTKRSIKAKNSQLQYNLNVSTRDKIYLDKRFIKIDVIDVDDRVYCVRVKNGNFYTMNNGKSHWTGNSAVVSLANVSHRIIDMWWQQEELYGKVQLAETPAGDKLKGLLKSGFKLGISSRGVGSVKTQNNQDIVQDDFELIAFDFVSSPSTPGAFLFKEGVEKWGMTPLLKNNSNLTNNIKVISEEKITNYEGLKTLLNGNIWKKL